MKIFSLLVLTVLTIGMVMLSGCCGASTGNVKENGFSGSPSSPAAPPHQVSGTGGNTTPTAAGPGSSTALNIENGAVGQTYTITYLGSTYDVTLVETAFAGSSYGSTKYLMAYFEIKNTGTSSQIIAPKIYALDSTQEKYDSTIAFGVDNKYSKTLDFFKELPPNTKMSGWASVEIVDTPQDYDLYFEYTNVYMSQTPNYIKYHITH